MNSSNENQIRLIDENGRVNYGIYSSPISEIDYRQFTLKTPMGLRIPNIIKGLMEKRFIFFGISGDDIIAGLALIDMKYLASGFFYGYDRKRENMVDRRKISHPFTIQIKPNPEEPEGSFSSSKLNIKIGSQAVSAQAPGLLLKANFELEPTNPLRLCTRTGYRGWVYTQKTTPIPVSGTIIIGTKQFEFASPQHMALMDWTMGFMRRETFWNWASSACTLTDGRAFGLNLSCGVNESGFTENAFWLDGTMHKVDTVNFQFNDDNLSEPWQIQSFDGKVELEFFPKIRKEEVSNKLLLAMRFTQLLGTFSGKLLKNDGKYETIKECPGWVEDHYTRW